MTDNEIRTAFIEMGMPNMGFEALGFCKPTEMERAIFEEERPPQPYVLYMGIETKKAFDKFLNEFAKSQ